MNNAVCLEFFTSHTHTSTHTHIHTRGTCILMCCVVITPRSTHWPQGKKVSMTRPVAAAASGCGWLWLHVTRCGQRNGFKLRPS